MIIKKPGEPAVGPGGRAPMEAEATASFAAAAAAASFMQIALWLFSEAENVTHLAGRKKNFPSREIAIKLSFCFGREYF